MTAATCPWCNAPRAEAPNCPKCGANYAKAEAIKKGGKAAPAPEPAEPTPVAPRSQIADLSNAVDPEGQVDSQLELKLCIAAVPAALAVAVLLHSFVPGLQRIVFGMPLHELGHSMTAWLCGFAAIPTLWLSHIPEERGFAAPVFVAGAMAYLAFLAWRAEKWLYVALCGAVFVLQAVGTFGLKQKTAQMLITFNGDGLGIVLATLLMASFFFGKGTQLYRGSLRWGFVFIGAMAFADMFATWWGARKDFALIPFGEQERAGASDATRMVDWYGWTADQLVHRYFVLGVACLTVLALVYAWGVWRAWNYAKAARK